MVGTVGGVFLEIGVGRRGMFAGGEICFFSGQASGTFFVASPTCRVGKDATG